MVRLLAGGGPATSAIRHRFCYDRDPIAGAASDVHAIRRLGDPETETVTDLLIAAQAAPPITIELPTAVSAAAWVIAVLLAAIGVLSGVVAYFLRRELKSNDAAHRALTGNVKTVESDVKKLLAGQGRYRRRAQHAPESALAPRDVSPARRFGPSPRSMTLRRSTRFAAFCGADPWKRSPALAQRVREQEANRLTPAATGGPLNASRHGDYHDNRHVSWR